jgi:hypothetical protein
MKYLATLLFAALTLLSCEPTTSRLIEVEIVTTSDIDSWLGWGSSGYTTLQFPDGHRERRGGVLGKVGDRFMLRY